MAPDSRSISTVLLPNRLNITFVPSGANSAYASPGEIPVSALGSALPVDGSAEPRALTGISPGEAYAEFAPDGTKVMFSRFGKSTVLIDLESGATETLPDGIADPTTWQRLAP